MRPQSIRSRHAPPQMSGIPAVFTVGGGMLLWLDSDFSGGVSDGSTSPAPTNRLAGTDVAVSITSGAGTITYWSSKWRGGSRNQSCWQLTNRSFRATGTKLVAAANGLGKNWTIMDVLRPSWNANNSANYPCYASGWDQFAAGSFSKATGISRTNNTRYAFGMYANASETVVDTGIHSQSALVLERQRQGGNQVQFAINKVQTSAVAYGSGVTFAIDGFSIGGWAGASVGNASGDAFWRACMVWDHALNSTERDAVYGYLFGPSGAYSGFEHFSSLGAT